MSDRPRNAWPLAWILLFLLGLAAALVASVSGFYYVFFGRYHVNVSWPEGKTQAMRSGIEAALPPPEGTVFVNVRLHAGFDLPYSESIYYLSDRSQTEILDHYKAMLEKHGWFVRIYQVNLPNVLEPSLSATNRPLIPTIVPIPNPSPGGPLNQVSYDISDPGGRANITIYFWPINRTRESAKFTYLVSSDSLEQAAKVLAAGR